MPHSTILLIDDEEDIREAIQDVLEEEGYSVRIASNGREGLESLSQGPLPALILLDLMMPEMDGFTFLKTIRKDPRLNRIPVITLSAAGEKTRFAMADGDLKKPIELDLLLDEVEKYCRAENLT